MKPQLWSVPSGLYCLLILCHLSVVISGKILFPNETVLGYNSPCKTSDNLWGVCTRDIFCPQVKLEISSKRICSFDGDDAIICCIRASELACNGFDVANGELYKVPPKSHFIGGIRAKPREHPHIAAIGWSESSSVSWKCGGSLISEQYLITAAHCASVRGIAPDIARVGVINLVDENPDDPPADYNITLILTHPEYKSSSTYNDIALIRIFPVRPIPSEIRPHPICIWPNKEIPKSTLLAMGYGTLYFGGRQSYELFVGTLQYVSQNECEAAFEFNQRLSRGLIESQMCAQDPDGTKDTCQGDSGGPIQFTNDSGIFKTNYIVGVTSFGQGCLGSTPGVYTRLHSYLDWIEPIVWSHFR